MAEIKTKPRVFVSARTMVQTFSAAQELAPSQVHSGNEIDYTYLRLLGEVLHMFWIMLFLLCLFMGYM